MRDAWVPELHVRRLGLLIPAATQTLAGSFAAHRQPSQARRTSVPWQSRVADRGKFNASIPLSGGGAE
jgi:hypothetical protein